MDEEASFLAQTIKSAVEKLCPLKKAIGRDPQPWWTKEIGTKRKHLRRLHNISLRNRNKDPMKAKQQWDQYKSLYKQYNKLIKFEKKKSWQKFCQENSSLKDIAKLTKNITDIELGTLKKEDGSFTNSPKEALDLLMSTHFPGSSEPDNPPTSIKHYIDPSIIPSLIITHQQVRDSFCSFNKFKAAGPDGIPPVAFHFLPDFLINRITNIYNRMLDTAYTPAPWRMSRVVYIPKGSRPDYLTPRAFRPITISDILLRGLEKITTWHNRSHTAIESLPNQYGFRSGYSTETVISKTIDKIESGILRNNFVLAVFFDIEGAFDNIQFDNVAESFNNLGIHPRIINWYDFYLRNRTVHATHSGESTCVQPRQGGGQGGSGSPQAWNASFQNAIELTISTPVESSGYADDIYNSTIGICINTLIDNMQIEINKLANWTKKNKLTLSIKKTKAIIFTRKYKIPPHKDLFINDTKIEFVESVKYLGVELDSKLSFSKHIFQVANKAKQALMTAKKAIGASWGLNPKYIRWIYTAIIRPMISYGSIAWQDKLKISSIKELERLQRLALLMMTGAIPSSPTSTLEILTSIEPIKLFLESVALKSRIRTRDQIGNPFWDGVGHKKIIGHHLLLNKKIKVIFGKSLELDSHSIDNKWAIDPITLKNTIRPSDTTIIIDFANKSEVMGVGWLILKNGSISHGASLFAKSSLSKANAMAFTIISILEKIQISGNSKLTIISRNSNALNAIKCARKITKLVVKVRNILANLAEVNLFRPNLQLVHQTRIAAMFAHQGTSRTGTEIPHIISKEEVKSIISEHFTTQWTKSWEKAAPRQSKLFLKGPDPKFKPLLNHLSKDQFRMFCHAITGHSNHLCKHKTRMGLSKNPECRLCLEEDETWDHIFFECPALNYWREDTHDDHIDTIIKMLKIEEIKELFNQ